MPVKSQGVHNWLDNIIVPTKTVEYRIGLLHETLDCLRDARLSVNLPKLELCKPVVEWLRMMIDSFGVRPASSKIDSITQLSQTIMIEKKSSVVWNEHIVACSCPIIKPLSLLFRTFYAIIDFEANARGNSRYNGEQYNMNR